MPAFQFLFSKKDKDLKHYRRYNDKNLSRLFNSKFIKLKISYYNFLLFIPISLAIIFFKVINYQFINDVEKKPNLIINYILYSIFRLEKFILNFINLPFGISVLSVYKKTY